MDDYINRRPPVPEGANPGQDGTSSQPTTHIESQPTGQVQGQTAQQPTMPNPAYQPGYQTNAQPNYQPNYAIPQEPPVNISSPHEEKHKKKGSHPVLIAIIGGLIGAFALFGILKLTGALNKTTATSSSSAGQTINISATDESATVAQAASAKALPSVVSVYEASSSGSGVGSGVILDTSGNILTNYHVIEDAQEITVYMNDTSYTAEVVGYDESSDLAVIKADFGSTTVTPITVGDSDSLVVGDWVMTIGSPYGLDQSCSAGIVSSLYRSTLLASSSGTTIYTNLIQTDAAINPGNSGGALVDNEGKLVGINSMLASSSGSNAGIGFAIPGNYAVKIANTIISGKTVEHAYLGLSMQTVTASNAQRNNLSVSQGAYVASITSGSAAETAGIQTGDIITAIDGKTISSADAVILAVRSHDVGDTISVTVMRGTEEKTISVTLGSDGGQNLYANTSSSSSSNGYGSNGYGSNGYGSNGYGSNSTGSSISGTSSSYTTTTYEIVGANGDTTYTV